MVLHLSTVRFLGHAGSDVELGYRTQAEITADHARDPLLATAGFLVEHGVLTPRTCSTDTTRPAPGSRTRRRPWSASPAWPAGHR